MYICYPHSSFISLKGDNEVQDIVDNQATEVQLRASPSETTVVSSTSSYALRATINAFDCNKAVEEAMRESPPSPLSKKQIRAANKKTRKETAKAEIAERKKNKSAAKALKKERKTFHKKQRKQSTAYAKMWKKEREINKKDQKRLNAIFKKRLRPDKKSKKLELLETKLENIRYAMRHGLEVESKEPKRRFRMYRKRNHSNILSELIGIS